ncbi:DUF882 domain-containing protein [Aquamicrobium sp. LC103]|nr:DUF882 domain-containing protein [Aquamicrobium sp. LC103]
MLTLCATAHASAETRSLKLYFIHTKERAEITYKRNGRYDAAGLQKINRFLRDWRRNEPAKMDPRLLDLVWEVYRSVGARDYIHVVSAYRSPTTNKMLRSRSSGVAEKSQHTLGKAMDFYIPGVPLSRLRAAAFRAEGGGVGYYPKSGSPFVHLDVGNVRSWPRMSRSELLALFPDGKTIHVPSDGKPLPGFNQALAAYEQRKRTGASVQVASAPNSRGGSGLLAALFGRGGGADEEEDSAPQVAAASARPAPSRAVPTPAAPVAAPERAPAPQTPETIIAALPARAVPVPGEAPRPRVEIGEPILLDTAPAAQQAVPNVPAETQVALNVPLPTRRPSYSPPAAENANVAQANANAGTDNVALAAIAGGGDRPVASEAITELLSMSAAEARADVVINNTPVPEARPNVDLAANVADENVEVAAISRNAERSDASNGDVFVLASLPDASPAKIVGASGAGAAATSEVAPSIAAKERALAEASSQASPRVAVLGRQAGSDAVAALDSGVRTTAKSAKPRANQARPEAKPMVVPVQHELTRWALQPESVTNASEGTRMPAMAYNIVRTAPREVYTAGFQQGATNTADANRFTGKAVTFLSVAKFN